MRRRTEAAVVELAVKGVALLLAVAVAYFAVVWPWLVGSHRSVPFAWALQIAYLILVGDIVQFSWRAHRTRRAQAVRAQAAREQTQREQTARDQAALAEAARLQRIAHDAAVRVATAEREQAERDRAEHRRRIAQATPRWARLATDAAGLQRWWDGNGWTDQTRWEVSAVRPDGKSFTHGACTVRHRTAATASQCRRG